MISDRAIMRAVLPNNGPKRLARLLDAPIETARSWYYRTLSTSRRQEIATALLKTLDEEDRLRAAVREQLVRMAANDDQVAGSLASAFMSKDRRAGARNTAPARGILVEEVMPCQLTMPSRRQRMRR